MLDVLHIRSLLEAAAHPFFFKFPEAALLPDEVPPVRLIFRRNSVGSKVTKMEL